MARRDIVDTRVLGALRFLDATTGQPIERSLKIDGAGLTLSANRSWLYVIRDIQATNEAERQLKAHLGAFEQPPDTPPIGSVSRTITVRDPLRVYMPRRAIVELPRLATPPVAADGSRADLFNPVDIRLFRSPAAAKAPNWSGLRLSLTDRSTADDPRPLAGALVTLTSGPGGEELATGQSDERGEAFVPIIGIPATVFVDDDEPPGDAPNGPVARPSIAVAFAIRSNAAGEWPIDPDHVGADPIVWAPLSDAFPDIDLKTGEVKNVRLDLRPQA